ncbi:Flp family type IVb pilin [Vibrio vulnificus]|uniref:Flp family type IVb pilin n=1 Tax=Vibrio vulnificus TaxID=672 RepID=UPI0012F753F5|nr:Flp family type IVb pilin [Vibrio vulnificus]ELK8509960.1 Flp family type IVb pilin [Vibrio vulnificus]ELK8996439.1 Flp family type IVb pilin [Vibrio vulnificus]ELS3555889.1 Flp family type IVb pilin [Vibrio vulnificus]MCJ0817189.1 Flp family type IVb pilin [Vibrio vulnificus]MVT23469.1 Flp family type IVb pilin [Vibrio vulnificus]
MSNLLHKAKAFMQDEEGLSVVEYVVGAALLVIAIGSVFTGLGGKLNTKLDGAIGS